MNSLNRLIDELGSFLPKESGDVNIVADENLLSIFLTSQEYEALNKVHLVTFINQAYKLIEKKWNKNFVFYAWFDSVAGQLRFSSIPGEYKKRLPFRRKISTTADVDKLVDEIFNEYSDMYKHTSICTKSNEPLLVLIIDPVTNSV